MGQDPLTEILRLTNAESVVSGGFDAGGGWAIRFPAMEKLSFSATVRGGCWLCFRTDADPVRLEEGDVVLVTAGRSFVLTGDLEAAPVDAASVFNGSTGGIVKVNGGGDYLQIGGFIQLDAATGQLLTDVLPPLIHIQAASAQAPLLHWIVDQLVNEQASGRAGSSFASEKLAQLMFVQILRSYLERATSIGVGWLRVLADPVLAPALKRMHAEPDRSWKLDELARETAMSRTAFAVRFKALAGIPPLKYLTAWRMSLAGRALRDEAIPVADVARSIGYASESAFSNAFKRFSGQAPSHYKAAARAAIQS